MSTTEQGGEQGEMRKIEAADLEVGHLLHTGGSLFAEVFAVEHGEDEGGNLEVRIKVGRCDGSNLRKFVFPPALDLMAIVASEPAVFNPALAEAEAAAVIEMIEDTRVRPDGPETDRGGLIGQGGY